MTKLPTNLTSRTPVVLTPSQHRRVEEMWVNLEEAGFRNFRFRSRDVVPTEGERLFLRQRGEQLDVWLQPASLRVIDAELTAMFSTMAFRSGDEKDLTLVNRIYRDDLAGLPSFALSKACSRFRKAEIGDGKFVPKQGELRKEAMRIAQPYFEERTRVEAVMSAEVPPAPVSLDERRATVERYKQTLKPVLEASRPLNEIERGYVEPVKPKRVASAEPEIREPPRLSEAAERAYHARWPKMDDCA